MGFQTETNLAKKVGIDLHAFYIIGFPRETMEQIHKTLNFAYEGLVRYNVVPHLSIARADPGTALYHEATNNNQLVTDYIIANAGGVRSDMFQRHLIQNDEFTPEQLELINEEFHKKCIRYILWNTILFMLKNPRIFFETITQLLSELYLERITKKQSIIKMFWCKLLYKNALKIDYFKVHSKS